LKYSPTESTLGGMRAPVAMLLAALFALAPVPMSAAAPTWEQWQTGSFANVTGVTSLNGIAFDPTSAHGEGHLAFTVTPPPQPSRSPIAIPIGQAHAIPVAPFVAIAAAVLAALAAAILAATRRRR